MKNQQPEVADHANGPDWDALRSVAAGQAGFFTAAQASERGFSQQLLSKHARSGTLERHLRGIYRLAHYPPGEHEDLVVAWLWSGGRALVSHESALQLHGLSDAMPARIHLTMPEEDRGVRRVVPPSYVLHHADVARFERTWIGAVPVTTPARTVRDVAASFGDPDLVRQAIDQGAVQRRLFTVWDVVAAIEYARSFDSVGWRVFPDAIADLGDAWAVHPFSGVCSAPPPADWPSLAREAASRHGGRIYSQRLFEGTRTLHVHVAWPMPGPSSDAVHALRVELGEAFGWR